MTSILIKNRREDTQRGKLCKGGGRDRGDAATSWGSRQQAEAGTGTEQILPKSLQRKHGLADTLILDLWLSE